VKKEKYFFHLIIIITSKFDVPPIKKKFIVWLRNGVKESQNLEVYVREFFYVKFMRNFYTVLRAIHADYVIFYIEFTPSCIFYVKIFVKFTCYCNYYAKFQKLNFSKKTCKLYVNFYAKILPYREIVMYDP